MKVTEGVLRIVSLKGKNVCPLNHTEVKANISGFIGITEVTQIFTNPMETPIEAEYIFPLPEKSAVFEMLMKIGDKTIKGIVKEKEEARKIYNNAIKKGKRASLLDEERPNIFVQHVGNIMPNDEIKILIKYVEDIKFEEGIYEYVFPMTVGPRYITKSMEGEEPKVNPAYVEEGKRAGHDISLSVEINSPINIEEINSELHEINIEKVSDTTSKIKLAEHDSIPNRDFILRYRVGSETIEEGLISTKTKDKSGFASLIIQPPSRPENYNIIPKEMIFVVDTSGSQSGAPLEVCKKAMNLCIDKMHKNDTFNIICFSNVPEFLFKKSMPNNRKNRELAKLFMKKHEEAWGGTEMLPPILAALKAEEDPERLRIITVMTDGCVGNEGEIISAIDKKCKKNTRVFSFGTGNSVNRYLITKMAEAGRGDSEIITVTHSSRDKENENMQKIADSFFKKIDCPLMTNIELNWSGDKLSEIYPKKLPDLYSNTPLILIGKYKEPKEGTVIITGKTANGVIEKKIDFKLNSEEDTRYESIPYLWARRKIEYYSDEDEGSNKEHSKIKEKIIKLGIKFGLATKYTSFVAVEDKVVNENGKVEKKEVPAEFPSGVSREGFESGVDHLEASSPCFRSRSYSSSSSSSYGGMKLDLLPTERGRGSKIDEFLNKTLLILGIVPLALLFLALSPIIGLIWGINWLINKLKENKSNNKLKDENLKYDGEKFDKYIHSLLDKISKSPKEKKYDVEFLKEEMKKEVGKKIINKNDKVKIKIKFLTTPEDTLKLIEKKKIKVIEKNEQEIIAKVKATEEGISNLIEISENSSVDKIELAKSSKS